MALTTFEKYESGASLNETYWGPLKSAASDSRFDAWEYGRIVSTVIVADTVIVC